MTTTSGRAALLLVAGTLVTVGCGECAPAEAAFSRPESFVVEKVRCGERLRAEVLVKNRRAKRCAVAAWRTSCDCLSIQPDTVSVEPADAARLTCALDFSSEPEFAGGLGIQVEGLDAARNVVLQFEVRVSVRQP